jgi:putative nucleotidyltransferase-like protein
MTNDAIAVARRIAAFGLSDAGQISIPEELWSEVLGQITFEHLTGLAMAMLEAGQLLLSDQQAEELLARQRDAMALALTNERKLLEIAGVFERQGVEFIVLKGPAVAHTFYPDSSWRPFVDIDVLVRTRDWERACAVLAMLGMRRRLPEPRRGFDVRFGKAAAHRGGDGVEVDLHRTLVVGPFGLWIKPDELFERTAPFDLGGLTFQRLGDSAVLLNACMHASLGSWPPQILPLRDVAQIAQSNCVNWDTIIDWGSRWRLSVVFKHAVETSSLVLGWEPSSEVRALRFASQSDRSSRAFAAYTTNRRTRGGTARSTLLAIYGLGAKVRYLAGMVVPQKRFLLARTPTATRRSYLRRWVVPVGWLTASSPWKYVRGTRR